MTVVVVADTTPLNYLVLIDAVEVLPLLFGAVTVPPAVLGELRRDRTPTTVRAWATRPPAWLQVVQPTERLITTGRLDPGEAEAISLAKELAAAAILLDERQGRAVAQREGLTVVRTLAVLERAAERGLVDLPEAIGRLRRTTFRIPEDHLKAALRRDAERRRAR